MKNLLIIFIITLCIGCYPFKKIDVDGYYTHEDYIMYKEDTVAKLTNIELSYDNGKFVKEATFQLLDMKYGDHGKSIIYFISKKHKDWEIELDYPIDGFVFK